MEVINKHTVAKRRKKMDEKKKMIFLPDPRVPEITAKNVEQVTHRVRIPIENAYLWHLQKEHGLVPFIGLYGRLPSGDHEVHWWPALRATILLDQLNDSVDPVAVSLRMAAELEKKFVKAANSHHDRVRGVRVNQDPDKGLKEYLEYEREKLAKGC
jgi:hypothetical protein